jgi:hypothetical protein
VLAPLACVITSRNYDYLLGGKDNYAPVGAACQLLKAAPKARDSARANRAFLQRPRRFLAGEAGIWQIIGISIPAAGNVHARHHRQIARRQQRISGRDMMS